MADTTEYLLTWNGAEGRIVSHGYRLMTDEPFSLPFAFAFLLFITAMIVISRIQEPKVEEEHA